VRREALVGALVVALAAGGGAWQAARAIAAWDRLGPLPPGDPAPEFDVPLLDGGRFGAADLPGKVTVLVFWATWCGVCRGELEDLDALAPTFADEPVQLVAIDREGGGVGPREAAALVRRYRAQTGLGLPIAIDDGTASKAFRVGPIPHVVLVDAQGVMRRVHQGRVSGATIAAEVEGLLGE
jgi:thiol-disulfide isomerase/thioredoxin